LSSDTTTEGSMYTDSDEDEGGRRFVVRRNDITHWDDKTAHVVSSAWSKLNKHRRMADSYFIASPDEVVVTDEAIPSCSPRASPRRSHRGGGNEKVVPTPSSRRYPPVVSQPSSYRQQSQPRDYRDGTSYDHYAYHHPQYSRGHSLTPSNNAHNKHNNNNNVTIASTPSGRSVNHYLRSSYGQQQRMKI
jgi:hypothetical protein